MNKAPVLRLVTSEPKKPQNDPGGSQGSGNFYEGPPSAPKPEEEVAPENKTEALESPEPHLKVVAGEAKPKLQSLKLVYEEFFKKKRETASSPGLTTQYSSDHANSKGMLLNKKAE